MPKVTVTDAKGLVQSKGSGVTFDSNVTFTGTVTGVTPAQKWTVDGTVTATGSNQATAAPLTGSTGYLYKLTSTAGSQGVVLAEATAGTTFVLVNDNLNDVNVYPPVGGYIADKGQNAADKASKNYKSMILICFDATPGAQRWTNVTT